MAKTYRDVAIEQMIATVEEAMSRVVDWWGDLPMPMHEAIDSFRVQLGAAIEAAALRGQAIGDGAVFRVIREVQERYFRPPELIPGGSGKYGR